MRTATALLVLLVACDQPAELEPRDVTPPVSSSDQLACLNAWHCSAACLQPYVEGDEILDAALGCAANCAQGSQRARGLFEQWHESNAELCLWAEPGPDPYYPTVRACVMDLWWPQMGTGAYLSTCLTPE